VRHVDDRVDERAQHDPPYYLHDKEIDKYDKRWNAKNAVASFNAQPGTDIGGLNQSIYFRRAASDYGVAPYCDGDCGKAFPSLSKFGPCFSSWLNAAKPAPVNGSYATVNLAPGSSKTADGWQQLATDGVVVFDDHSTCGYNGTGKSTVYAHYTSHNTIYSPSPWTANTGGTIGGGTPAEGTDPCSIKIPIAFLKGRTATQGTTWPSAPVITSTGTVAATATLVATGCPSGGCVWAISSDGAPAGLTLSATGSFSWPGATSGQTTNVQVVAGNNVAYSPPVTLTGRAPQGAGRSVLVEPGARRRPGLLVHDEVEAARWRQVVALLAVEAVLAQQHLGDAQAVDRGGGGGAEQVAALQPLDDLLEQVAGRDQGRRGGGLVAGGLRGERGGELVTVLAQGVAATRRPARARRLDGQQACSLGLCRGEARLAATQPALAQEPLAAEDQEHAEGGAPAAALDHRRGRGPVDLLLEGRQLRRRHGCRVPGITLHFAAAGPPDRRLGFVACTPCAGPSSCSTSTAPSSTPSS
jgi:hypothetical protein